MNGIIDILEHYRANILPLRDYKKIEDIKAKKSELVTELRSKVKSLSLPQDKIAGINNLIDDIEKAEDPDTIIKLINDLIALIEQLIKEYTLDFSNGKGRGI